MIAERYLLDTHAWLWLIAEAPELKAPDRRDLLAVQAGWHAVCERIPLLGGLPEGEHRQGGPGGRVIVCSQSSFDDRALQIAHTTPSMMLESNRSGTLYGDPGEPHFSCYRARTGYDHADARRLLPGVRSKAT